MGRPNCGGYVDEKGPMAEGPSYVYADIGGLGRVKLGASG